MDGWVEGKTGSRIGGVAVGCLSVLSVVSVALLNRSSLTVDCQSSLRLDQESGKEVEPILMTPR